MLLSSLQLLFSMSDSLFKSLLKRASLVFIPLLRCNTWIMKVTYMVRTSGYFMIFWFYSLQHSVSTGRIPTYRKDKWKLDVFIRRNRITICLFH
uniref:Secreted protein n=1 Tax=Haemonchus contortus TaxID=6289 RepID=A0A7I4YLA1_HAECO